MKLIKVISIVAAASLIGVIAQAQPAEPKADDNASSEVVQKKLPPHVKAMILKKFDKDGDGYLNEEELAEAKKGINERKAKFEEMQKKFAEDILKKYDKDSDGKLSAEELIPFLAKQHQMFAELKMRQDDRGRAPMMKNNRHNRPHGHMAPSHRQMRKMGPPPPPMEGCPMMKKGDRKGFKGDRQGPRPEGRKFDGQKPEGKKFDQRPAPRAPITADDLDQLAKPKS